MTHPFRTNQSEPRSGGTAKPQLGSESLCHRAPLPLSSGPRLATRHRRRGNSYIFFLGMSMLVAVVGLSALSGVRIKRQSTLRFNERASAQVHAQSAVDFALLQMYLETDWRDKTPYDQWSAAQPIGSGTMSWKIRDDNNGDFTTDRNAIVRMFGKGTSGQSVWVYSVQVQPPPETMTPELFTNGNLESGATAPWFPNGCSLKLDSSIKHAGLNSLVIWQQTLANGGARQTVTTQIQPDVTYALQGWVYAKTPPETVTIAAHVSTDDGWLTFPITSIVATTSWQFAQGTFTPTWTGGVKNAYVEVAGTTGTSEILLDDFTLKSQPALIGIIPGTWKREAQ